MNDISNEGVHLSLPYDMNFFSLNQFCNDLYLWIGHGIYQFFREHSIGTSLKRAVHLTLQPQLSILNRIT